MCRIVNHHRAESLFFCLLGGGGIFSKVCVSEECLFCLTRMTCLSFKFSRNLQTMKEDKGKI